MNSRPPGMMSYRNERLWYELTDSVFPNRIPCQQINKNIHGEGFHKRKLLDICRATGRLLAVSGARSRDIADPPSEPESEVLFPWWVY